METSFKVSKKGKYFEIDYVTGLTYTPNNYRTNEWSLSKQDAKSFIQYMIDIEKHVTNSLKERELSYDFRLVILMHLQTIGSISSGLDVRSNKTTSELADIFVDNYDRKYNDAFSVCSDTLKFVEVHGKFSSYYHHYTRYDRYNELVTEFKLPFRKITLEDFRQNPLVEIEYLLDELKERLEK